MRNVYANESRRQIVNHRWQSTPLPPPFLPHVLSHNVRSVLLFYLLWRTVYLCQLYSHASLPRGLLQKDDDVQNHRRAMGLCMMWTRICSFVCVRSYICVSRGRDDLFSLVGTVHYISLSFRRTEMYITHSICPSAVRPPVRPSVRRLCSLANGLLPNWKVIHSCKLICYSFYASL